MVQKTQEAFCAKGGVLGWIDVKVGAIILLIKLVVYMPFDYIYETFSLKLSFDMNAIVREYLFNFCL